MYRLYINVCIPAAAVNAKRFGSIFHLCSYATSGDGTIFVQHAQIEIKGEVRTKVHDERMRGAG